MPVNVKKWLEEKSAELGLSESERATAEKLMESDKFKSDFVGLPDFHSALDKQKQKFQAQYDDVYQKNLEWQEEYETKYAPALTALQKLQQGGYDMSGFQNDNRGGVVNRQGQTISADEIARMIDERVNARVEPVRAGAIDWGTFVAEKAVEYSQEYGKTFKPSAFRKFAYDNREEYPTFQMAYDAFTAEDRKAKEAADKEDWKKQERERIRLELMSSQSLPEAAGDNGAPAFLAVEQKDSISRDADRQAFAKQWANVDFSKVTS